MAVDWIIRWSIAAAVIVAAAGGLALVMNVQCCIHGAPGNPSELARVARPGAMRILGGGMPCSSRSVIQASSQPPNHCEWSPGLGSAESIGRDVP